MITAISMDWIPREGVMWAAKYSSSGMRSFTTFGLGVENPIAHRNPPWSAMTDIRKVSEPLTASFVDSIQAEDPRQGRARSAPTPLRQSAGRAVGGRKKECFSGKQNSSRAGTMDQEPKMWRHSSSDRIDSCRRAHSAGHFTAPGKPAGEGPRSPCLSAPFRARSAWGRLAKHVVSEPLPEPEPPKSLWGDMIARLPAAGSPPPSPTTPAPSSTSRSTSAMSEVSLPAGASSPKPWPPAAVSRTSFRPTSAGRTSPDPLSGASRPESPISRPLRPLVLSPSISSDSASTIIREVFRSPSDTPRSVSSQRQESGQPLAEDAAAACFESPDEDLEDLELPSAGKREREGGVKASARSQASPARGCAGARPDSALTQQHGEFEALQERSSACTQKSWFPPSSKGDNTSRTSQFRSFASEVWYKKGCKLLAAQRATRKVPSHNESEELDPEFLLQRLIRPTASSRSRQVTHWPAASYTHSSGAPQHKQKTPNRAVFAVHRPNRFKGARSVTPTELRDIVTRLSACDPASVPDSGRSRSRGKGLGDRCHGAAWSEPASTRSKSRSGLYVRGFSEELVRRSHNNA